MVIGCEERYATDPPFPSRSITGPVAPLALAARVGHDAVDIVPLTPRCALELR